MFSIQLCPKSDESLASYLVRLSLENGISILTLWNKSRKQGMPNPQREDLHLIDTLPNSVLDIERLSFLCSVPASTLYKGTFNNLYLVFNYDGIAETSRYLKGIIRSEIHFCPDCLSEKPYIRSLWRIDGITCCTKHSRYLQECCQHCGHSINVNQLFNSSICPHCYGDLSSGGLKRQVSTDVMIAQEWSSMAWAELIYDSSLPPTNEKELGLKLLYVVNRKDPVYNRFKIKSALNSYNLRLDSILQCTRGTLKQRRKLHLNKILKILFDHNISISEFLNISIPMSFKRSVIKDNSKKFKIVCLSPWCVSYGTDRSIVKTGTLSKNYKDGSYLKRHVACLDCGCEYGFDKDGEVKEKSYFAKGYRFLQRFKPLSLAEFQRTSGFSLNACGRIVAYLHVRGLYDFRPVTVNEELLTSFAEGVSKNMRISDIQKWSCWNDKFHYLIHRLHPDIMRRLIQQKRPAKDRLPKLECWGKLVQYCDEYLSADVTITIESIALKIGITSATISKWGYTPYIKEMKEEQKKFRLEKRKDEWYKKIDDLCAQNINNKVLSKDVYKHLKVKQSYLCGIAPEVNEYIRSCRAEIS
ncbi:TniQ family protein [Paenibacillus sp. FSL M7-1046]|uniref:TniQ family protein n=1 Tax=Paenibacillus sp. FSL M7-1046 TaxID=2975315 RepID=UPI0030F96977